MKQWSDDDLKIIELIGYTEEEVSCGNCKFRIRQTNHDTYDYNECSHPESEFIEVALHGRCKNHAKINIKPNGDNQ